MSLPILRGSIYSGSFFSNSLTKGVFFMKDIKEFRIGKANYLLENDNGSKLKLTLDYGKNEFKTKILKDGGNAGRLSEQAEIVAKNLLAKKAQRNLSYKLLKLK
jgi:hypothetical protein